MSLSPPPSSRRSPGTVEAARAYLLDRVDYERRPAPLPDAFRLDGIRRLLHALGDPQERIPAVHVAGTKGKGSTSAMIAAGLTACGLRTGLFTSPHMEVLEERFRVDGELPTPEVVVRLVDRLAEIESAVEPRPTFFELVTALAWTYFDAAGADVAVMEVGMGGRLDSTNVCRPLVTVVTNVSRDHERLLGSTLEAIAREKAGIVKLGVPCISGVDAEEAAAVVRSTCHDAGAALWECGTDVTVRQLASQESAGRSEDPLERMRTSIEVTTPTGTWPPLRVPLAGDHQVRNAAVAVAALERLHESGRFPIDRGAAALGIERLTWPLRFEVVRERPLVVCDAAHNEASIGAVVRTLAGFDDRSPRVLIFAVASDKDQSAMLRPLLPAFDHVIFTRFVGNPRSVSPETLARLATSMSAESASVVVAETECAAEPVTALERALEIAGSGGLVCATGSFFLASEVRRAAGLLTR